MGTSMVPPTPVPSQVRRNCEEFAAMISTRSPGAAPASASRSAIDSAWASDSA